MIINLYKIAFTRSGDKGGCANLGVWAKKDHAYDYLFDLF